MCEAVIDVALGGYPSIPAQEPVSQIYNLMSLWTHAYFPLLVHRSYLNLMTMGLFS